MRINLNADLGESFGPWPKGQDSDLLNVVDSANVACGFHAGDPLVMKNTVQRAAECQVSIGAHPGYPDLQGFGRRPMSVPGDELAAMVVYQLAALQGICRSQGIRMTHVKPHGALNNQAAEDRALADVIAAAVRQIDASLILLAPALSELAAASQAAGLDTALEVFADRRYTSRGTLVSRREPGAVLDNAGECIAHVRAMMQAGGIVDLHGEVLETPFHSICVHGDNAHAVDTARTLRQALLDDGHELLTLPEMMQLDDADVAPAP